MAAPLFRCIMILNLFNTYPGAIAAIDTDGNSITYGDIVDLSLKLKELLPARSLVFILAENNCGGIAWVMATILSGNVPLILNAHTDNSLLNGLTDTYQPQFIIKRTASNPGNAPIYDEFGYSIEALGNPPAQMDSELSHLLPTSGSTGSPKLVRHKYENIEASALNISTFFRLTKADRPLLVLPLYYTMGLSVVFSHLKVGATILITDRKMTDPEFWRFIKEQRATSFTGVPFSYEILDKMRFFRMKLPDLTLLTQGGGKMPAELNLKFAEFCRDNGKRWVATYGQSEGTARMAWLPEEYALSKLGSIGIAVPNGELFLRDSTGRIIEESPATGEMCYRGRNVTMGYARSRADLALGDERHGELSTGDIAYRDADGFYFIKGRMGRFLKIYGNRIGLDECEHIVRGAIAGECACSGNDERLVVFLTQNDDEPRALDVLTRTLKLPANVIEIRHTDAIPKNEAGKILYSQLESF